jgi:diguanylate cyclase (GGDEF)-like protein
MRLLEVADFSRLLRNALLTFFLVGTVALFSYGVYGWQREEQDAHENLQTFSGFLASASQAFFDELGNGLAPLGELLDRPELYVSPETLRPYLATFQNRHPQVRAVAVFAPDGEMLLNTAVKPGDPMPDFRLDPPYIKQLLADMANPAPYTVGPPEFGKAIKRWRFTVRHVLRGRDGRPKFLVQAAVPLEKEGTFLHQLPIPSTSYIGLLRADGYQQARFPVTDANATYGRLSPGPVARIIKANPGIHGGHFSGSSPWVAGDKQRIGAFAKLSGLGLYAYVSVPASYVTTRWWRHNAPIFISFLVFFGIFVAIAYRVTKRERFHSNELIEQARRDALTGLPNRGCLTGILEANIAVARAGKPPFSILFLDLDRFKGINDALGHAMGDGLLIKVAQRIQPLLRHGDVLGRFGGDEFLLVLPDSNETGAILITHRILDAFSIPFEVNGHALRITPSIGIAIYPEHGDDLETLLKHADTAMYESKRLGRNAYTVYTEQMGLRVRERLDLENELRDALQREAFRLVYQPIVDMRSGEIVAVEALVRWVMPDGKLRAPATFIQAAEDSGLIIHLGQWVLRTACLQMKQWVSSGLNLRVAVNLSTHQFQDPQLIEKVTVALRETGMEAARLELEVTESAAMLNPEESMKILGKLSELGVRIAIDDFGTGYSSLSYLNRIPANTIKIDKMFVDGLGQKQDATIVRAVIALARALEKETIAEGIETEEQFDAIKAMGCDSAQGYWVSRPIEADAMFSMLSQNARLVAESKTIQGETVTWIHTHGKSVD